jgi:PAS domain S-box-containing protein
MVQDSDRLHPNAITAPAQPAILTPDLNSREHKLLEEIATLQDLVAQLQRRNDDLMEAELALQERESQFQVLVEHSQDIIYVHSADGIFSYVSPSIQTVLGYAMAETVGKSFLDWIHPHDLVRWWNILESIQRHQEPILGQPMRMRHIDQTWRWLTINVTPILDENQQITGYQGIARNITERFEAEAAQRKAQDQVKSTHDFLSGILNHIPDPIFVKDQQGKFILVNRAFCRLIATTPQEVMGRFNHEILPLELARVYQVLDQTTLKTAAPQSAEITYTNQAGQQVFLYTNQRLYKDAQGSEFLIGIMRDLTDYKNTKEALGQVQQQLIQIEKMSSLGMMVAGIAHEIKSPLNFVAGNLMPLDRDVSTIFRLLDLYQQEVPQPSAALAEAISNSDLEFLRHCTIATKVCPSRY